jgi:hypothetical protein
LTTLLWILQDIFDIWEVRRMAASKDERKLVVVPLRVEPRIKLELERLARRDRRRPGELARLIVTDFVKSEVAKARKSA